MHILIREWWRMFNLLMSCTLLHKGKVKAQLCIVHHPCTDPLLLSTPSVTRLGDLLDFGQFFKAFGNKKFVQISHILRQFL